MGKAVGIFAVSRIENKVAVLENDDGSLFEVSLSDLPVGTQEGSILRYTDKGEYFIDIEEEKRRRRSNFLLQESLFD